MHLLRELRQIRRSILADVYRWTVTYHNAAGRHAWESVGAAQVMLAATGSDRARQEATWTQCNTLYYNRIEKVQRAS
jgi:hypothetical protein